MVNIGYGSSLAYRAGYLCYLSGRYVRILDVWCDPVREQVIDTAILNNQIDNPRHTIGTEILYYSNGLVTLRFTQHPPQGIRSHLVIAVETTVVRPRDRPLLQIIPWNTRQLLVRNDGTHIVVATYTGTFWPQRGLSRHEWQIRFITRPGCSPATFWSHPVQLRDFFGIDVGQTVAFEIFDGHLYAVSNQSTFEVEEVDWTSYYHCWRINLFEPDRIQHRRVWRRQHREGPIRDDFTDLSLRKDEKTGVVTIIEARREWLENSSQSARTFYFQPLEFGDREDSVVGCYDPTAGAVIAVPNSTDINNTPANDVLARTLTKDDKPNFEEVSPSLQSPYKYPKKSQFNSLSTDFEADLHHPNSHQSATPPATTANPIPHPIFQQRCQAPTNTAPTSPAPPALSISFRPAGVSIPASVSPRAILRRLSIRTLSCSGPRCGIGGMVW